MAVPFRLSLSVIAAAVLAAAVCVLGSSAAPAVVGAPAALLYANPSWQCSGAVPEAPVLEQWLAARVMWTQEQAPMSLQDAVGQKIHRLLVHGRANRAHALYAAARAAWGAEVAVGLARSRTDAVSLYQASTSLQGAPSAGMQGFAAALRLHASLLADTLRGHAAAGDREREEARFAPGTTRALAAAHKLVTAADRRGNREAAAPATLSAAYRAAAIADVVLAAVEAGALEHDADQWQPMLSLAAARAEGALAYLAGWEDGEAGRGQARTTRLDVLWLAARFQIIRDPSVAAATARLFLPRIAPLAGGGAPQSFTDIVAALACSTGTSQHVALLSTAAYSDGAITLVSQSDTCPDLSGADTAQWFGAHGALGSARSVRAARGADPGCGCCWTAAVEKAVPAAGTLVLSRHGVPVSVGILPALGLGTLEAPAPAPAGPAPTLSTCTWSRTADTLFFPGTTAAPLGADGHGSAPVDAACAVGAAPMLVGPHHTIALRASVSGTARDAGTVLRLADTHTGRVWAYPLAGAGTSADPFTTVLRPLLDWHPRHAAAWLMEEAPRHGITYRDDHEALAISALAWYRAGAPVRSPVDAAWTSAVPEAGCAPDGHAALAPLLHTSPRPLALDAHILTPDGEAIPIGQIRTEPVPSVVGAAQAWARGPDAELLAAAGIPRFVCDAPGRAWPAPVLPTIAYAFAPRVRRIQRVVALAAAAAILVSGVVFAAAATARLCHLPRGSFTPLAVSRAQSRTLSAHYAAARASAHAPRTPPFITLAPHLPALAAGAVCAAATGAIGYCIWRLFMGARALDTLVFYLPALAALAFSTIVLSAHRASLRQRAQLISVLGLASPAAGSAKQH